jgi:hypothetical protein
LRRRALVPTAVVAALLIAVDGAGLGSPLGGD